MTVAGEVMFPTAVAWRGDAGVKDYITKAGGFGGTVPRPGDEIMVLPEPNVKNLQLGKALAEILFQLAVTTSVVTGL